MLTKIFLKIIHIYQKVNLFLINSNVKKPSCVFYPTCSEYSKQSLKKYGFLRGLFISLKRIIRCHPWQKNNFDPLK